MRFPSLCRGLGAAVGLHALCTAAAQAQIFTETGDARQLLGSAQAVGDPVNRIEGALTPGGDIDLFRAVFDFTGTLTVDATTLTGANLDLNLHAFNAAGNPIGADDDSGPDLDSRLVLSITPGTYYFGVGDNNLEALDSTNTIIQDNDNGILNPAGVLAGWQGPGPDTGTYAITFSTPTAAPQQAAIPEPGTLSLLLVGTLTTGAGFLRRRRA